MNAGATTHIFIDTNVAMHYQRPDQVDWKKLLDAASVVLVAAPILLSELEKQKVQNPSRKLRERADAFIRWLVPFVRDPSTEVRACVRWHFIAEEPTIDFKSANLSREVADDQLIASVLCYKPGDGGQVCVATGDIGLEVKVRAWQIAYVPLPDDLRLQGEPDPLEKEVQELRRRVARQREPVLALTWADGTPYYKITAQPVITRPKAKSIDEVRSRFSYLAKPGERPVRDGGGIHDFARIAAQLQNTFLSAESIDRYNEKLKAYFVEYEAYLAELLEWESQRALTGPLRLILSNRGSAPASQIDVMLTFPEDILLMEKGDLPKKPKAPEAPEKPATSLGELMSPRLFHGDVPSLFPGHLYQPRALTRDGVPDIDGGGHKVSFSISTLKHLFDFTLKGVYFRFPAREVVRSCQVQYHVSAAELPDAVTGVLHIAVENAGSAGD